MNRLFTTVIPPLFFLFIVNALLLGNPSASMATEALTNADLIEVGRRIYQNGESADGSYIKAFVLGDVEVSGAQFSCLSCHRRSGLGGQEGTEFVLPTNGGSLLIPRTDMYMARPAYNFETFAYALESGVNPAGKELGRIMPRYELSDVEMQALFSYLKVLSSDISAGLTDEELHVATVVSTDVDPELKNAMLDVIKTYFNSKNGQTRHEVRRSQSGPFYHDYRNQAYRRWVHHVWELNGPEESWPAQLEKHYRQQPVFATISGMVQGSWASIHDFCESKNLPALLPNTDMPKIKYPADYYTLYFSKGLQLEAEVLSKHLSGTAADVVIRQIVRAGSDGAKAAQLLEKLLVEKNLRSEIIFLDAGDTANAIVDNTPEKKRPGAIVLWLNQSDLKYFSYAITKAGSNLPIYLSASMLDSEIELIPDMIAANAQVVSPFILQEDQPGRFRLFSAWLKQNKVQLVSARIQGQTYFACMLLNSGMKHIKKYFYREYFLDSLDHGDKMASYSANYPRLSFGPEQRFLAKGAYIVNLESGIARWIVPGH